MKKLLTTAAMTVLVLTLFLVPACGKQGGPGGSAAGSMKLFSMLPDNSTGVIFINFQDMAKMEFFDKMVKEEKPAKPDSTFKDYQDFVDKTGIDPKKDVYALAIAIIGNIDPTSTAPGVLVAHLNYDKGKILAILQEKKVEYTEEAYKGIQLYIFKEKKRDGSDEEFAFAFIDESIAAGGKPEELKRVIDLSKGQGQSIMANAKMKPYIEKFSGLVSFIFDFPADAKKVHDMGMAKIDLTKAEAIQGFFDFKDNAYIGEINMVCPNLEGNNQLVSTLNGFKGMAGLAGQEAMDVVNKINLNASAEKVSLSFNIPSELLDRVKKKLEEKVKINAEPATTPTDTPTETPTE